MAPRYEAGPEAGNAAAAGAARARERGGEAEVEREGAFLQHAVLACHCW
jgi:hypothetical protein